MKKAPGPEVCPGLRGVTRTRLGELQVPPGKAMSAALLGYQSEGQEREKLICYQKQRLQSGQRLR